MQNVNELGYKTQLYEAVFTDPAIGAKTHSPVHTWVMRLIMLALVPAAVVPHVLNQLVEAIPAEVQTTTSSPSTRPSPLLLDMLIPLYTTSSLP